MSESTIVEPSRTTPSVVYVYPRNNTNDVLLCIYFEADPSRSDQCRAAVVAYYRHQGHEVAIIQCRSKDDFLQQQPTTAAYLITVLDLSEAVIAAGTNILASTSLQDAPIVTAEAVAPIGTGTADPPAVHQVNPSAGQTQVTSSLSRRDEMSQNNLPPLTVVSQHNPQPLTVVPVADPPIEIRGLHLSHPSTSGRGIIHNQRRRDPPGDPPDERHPPSQSSNMGGNSSRLHPTYYLPSNPSQFSVSSVGGHHPSVSSMGGHVSPPHYYSSSSSGPHLIPNGYGFHPSPYHMGGSSLSPSVPHSITHMSPVGHLPSSTSGSSSTPLGSSASAPPASSPVPRMKHTSFKYVISDKPSYLKCLPFIKVLLRNDLYSTGLSDDSLVTTPENKEAS